MKKKIVFLPYDMDTCIGTNNEGSLVFGYGLEDTDQTEGGADVFNGQQSVLWNNLRNNFSPELAAMYKDLRSKGTLSYDVVEKMFEDHQAKWPEAIFNEDAWYKYLAPLEEDNNASYLAMLQGSKASQRKWWLINRFRYMDSKYNAGEALTNVITVRGYAKDNVTVTPYADIYAAVKFGSYLTQKRAKRNVAVTLECPLDNVNDTEIYIYSAGQIASVGDLSGLKVGYADFTTAVKLQEIKLGDESSSYDNGNLTTLYLGNNTLLQTIDVRNCSGLGTADQTTVDISGCTNIRKAYFEGTKITGLTLPDGGVLETLHLPGTITILKVLNQTRLSDFTCPDLSGVTTLWLDNAGSTIDGVEIMSQMKSGSRVRLFHFTYEEDDHKLYTFINLLGTMRGLDQNGSNTDTAQVLGTVHVPVASQWLLDKASAYSDLAVTYDSLYETVLYYNYDSSFLDFELVENGKDAAASLSPERPMSNTTIYTFDGWAATADGDADSTLLTAISGETSAYAHYAESVRYYRVRFYNGSTLEDTQSVTYGSYARYYDGDRTPVYNGAGYAEDYVFTGWDKDLSSITEDTDTYAQYEYVPVYARKYLQDRLTTYTDLSTTGADVDSITFVGAFAFAGNTNLEELNLPLLTFSDWKVPEMAFATLSAISSFTFNADMSAVKEIEDYAFYNFIGSRQKKDSYGKNIITDMEFPNVLTLGTRSFARVGEFRLSFPALETEGSMSFANSYVRVLRLPKLKSLTASMHKSEYLYMLEELYLSSLTGTVNPLSLFFSSENSNLKIADIGLTTTLDTSFANFTAFETLVMRSTTMVAFKTASVYSSGVFYSSSPIGTGAGKIYVPSDLIDSYKAADGWKQYADVFTAIEGSEYEIETTS